MKYYMQQKRTDPVELKKKKKVRQLSHHSCVLALQKFYLFTHWPPAQKSVLPPSPRAPAGLCAQPALPVPAPTLSSYFSSRVCSVVGGTDLWSLTRGISH